MAKGASGGGEGVWVALLRGINVSGHNPIAMNDLRELFVALPAEGVATYVQSGNVVFRSTVADRNALRVLIEERIASQIGLEVVVVVRAAKELDQVVAGNPFVAEDGDRSHLYVTFLAARPDPARVAALSAPAGADTFQLGAGPQEVYLYCPGGFGRTKLNNAFFERKLAVAATTRNWRTVTSLAAMAHG